MNEISLTLNVNEVNIILDALGAKSYIAVFELIGKIQQQAEQQLTDVKSKSTNDKG
jgi:hypothetical protein